jgi:hypothetical protein
MFLINILRVNSVAFSPQANYTDRATAPCRQSWCQLSRIEGVAWSAQRLPTAVDLGFLDRIFYGFSCENIYDKNKINIWISLRLSGLFSFKS